MVPSSAVRTKDCKARQMVESTVEIWVKDFLTARRCVVLQKLLSTDAMKKTSKNMAMKMSKMIPVAMMENAAVTLRFVPEGTVVQGRTGRYIRAYLQITGSDW